ncbi:MAG: GDSL-type esterase/lipase family protein [Verrucomicrobiae bacterium]
MKPIFRKLALLALFIGAPLFANALDLKDGDQIAVLSGQNFEIWSCGPSGYIRLLLNEFTKAGIKQEPRLIALEGKKTEQMLARLDDEVIAKKPVVALIIPGTEDYNPWAEKTVSESFKNNLDAIIGKLHAASIKTVLVTSYACNSNLAFIPNQNVAEHNDAIRSMAKEHGLPLIDFVKVVDNEKKIVPFDRSLMARAVVNQMLTGEILRVLGYSDQEVAACRQAWPLEFPPSVSNNTYAKLRTAAKASGKEVDAYITEVLHDSVK